MTNLPANILIADDDSDILSALSLALKGKQYRVTTASTPHQVLTLLSRKQFCCLLIDLNYSQDTTSGKEGISLVQSIRKIDKHVPIIAITGYGSIDIAVSAMQSGANDFIEKPWRNNQLLTKVGQHTEHVATLRKNQKLLQENQLLKQHKQVPLIAQSQAMQTLQEQINRIALSDMNILLTGENGTGKSLLASYIHQQSKRNDHSFITVNMGGISESLFESEMFGHVKGAFTDAKEDRVGRFELASQGTLFLDEIANININQQAKLLHVLEERKFERVGSNITLDNDVRLISATNADLTEMINDGQFRQDLLYRLNTIELRVPPLRERTEDILPLAEHFLERLCNKYHLDKKELAQQAIEFMLLYQWPGNIRELHHTMERSIFLSNSEYIELAHLNLPGEQTLASKNSHEPSDLTLEQIEKSVIIERLQRFNNDPLQTAQSLGLSRSAYYRRLDKYRLNVC
ncbi:sigma-54-dependent Fis family transcriptional regulator [Thalassotalea insulae]|uniref:Sigma-54-dependent Fis family transcriptional regulator n=1 Tax=Thalassotalea insulae TaxID=2056778 RepID=A0ABQ6GY05_9GAMM|nr:sigma-54 dependent transcriptional regulator [Thalassotalea insulae]GLX80209.1 sigma-54-dependent Fis family transcriptional regulator [Thalassotalea insulae]